MIRFVLTAFVVVVLAVPARAAVEIQEVTTPEGFNAWLVEEHSIPFAAIEIRFRGGTSLDADGKRGATNLMMGLLEEGSGDMDSRAYAEAREALATSIRFDSSDDSVSVSLRFLSENRDASVALARQALTDPTFPQDALDRVREQVLSGLSADLTDPSAIARETFSAAVWGDHPYGSPSEGAIDSVTALTREDMIDAHRRTIAKDRVFIGAVGDITPEELAEVLDTLLGDLPETGAPLPEQATYQGTPGIEVVSFDTPQSVALFGHEGIARDDPDFFAAYVVNEIFGGNGFESRLMREIRVKRGLTYGIGAYLSPRDLGALIIGQVSTENARMNETIEVLRDEWRKIAEEGVTEEELEAAKTYLTGAYPLRFDGNATIARIMVGMQMDALPVDYIATRNANIEAVTLEEARRVAARIYQPDALVVTVVGQPEGLTPGN